MKTTIKLLAIAISVFILSGCVTSKLVKITNINQLPILKSDNAFEKSESGEVEAIAIDRQGSLTMKKTSEWKEIPVSEAVEKIPQMDEARAIVIENGEETTNEGLLFTKDSDEFSYRVTSNINKGSFEIKVEENNGGNGDGGGGGGGGGGSDGNGD